MNFPQDGYQVTISGQNELVLTHAQAAIDHSITTNRREDGLYHAYNLLDVRGDSLNIDRLYPMLEGQVSALSTGAMQPAVAVEVLEALFESSVYRPGQQSFMLYPDRELPRFLEKNCIPPEAVHQIPLLTQMLERNDTRMIAQDLAGRYRFNATAASLTWA